MGLGDDISSFSLIAKLIVVSFIIGKIYEAANMILCKPTKFYKKTVQNALPIPL